MRIKSACWDRLSLKHLGDRKQKYQVETDSGSQCSKRRNRLESETWTCHQVGGVYSHGNVEKPKPKSKGTSIRVSSKRNLPRSLKRICQGSGRKPGEHRVGKQRGEGVRVRVG